MGCAGKIHNAVRAELVYLIKKSLSEFLQTIFSGKSSENLFGFVPLSLRKREYCLESIGKGARIIFRKCESFSCMNGEIAACRDNQTPAGGSLEYRLVVHSLRKAVH